MRAAIAAGIPVIVPAGNQGEDVNNYSPARVVEAITVGATTIDDYYCSFGNWGDKVDFLAPGQDIPSLSHESDNVYYPLSGTSMAA